MRLVITLRWIARVLGIASTLLLMAFAFGGAEHLRMTASEAIAFLFFPLGLIVGFAVAWRWEWAGGMISVGSLALFYLWLFARDGRWPSGPYFLLFAIPGFLHIATALLSSRQRMGNSGRV